VFVFWGSLVLPVTLSLLSRGRCTLSRALSWLRKLGWKKWLLITVPIVIIIILVVVVAVPAIMYYSRNRHAVDYSETLAQATAVYSVTYDSGDGFD